MADENPSRLPPSPLDDWDRFTARLAGRRPVVFLDFDGTLAPIVERPQDAAIPDATRRAVERLARRVPVAVISGRGLDDVAGRVALPHLHYAGSHGFEIQSPSAGGEPERRGFGDPFQPLIEEASRALHEDLAGVPGAQVEPKGRTVAVHYRRVAAADRPRVEEAVERVVERQPKLARHGGKKVYEIRPALDWHKGRAVTWLLDRLDPGSPDALPIYVGDDVTDEDAFAELEEHGGVGIAVLDAPRPTRAAWSLRDPNEVRRFLERLSEAV